MATSKSAAANPKPAAKTSSTKSAAPRGIPAPSIKAADVVVPKMSVVAALASPTGATDATAAADGDGDQVTMLKKQELIERIIKASGAKKKDVKLIVDATLGVLGDALSAGEELNLPPLGKMKVNRTRDEGNAEVLILKLRRGGGNGGGSGSGGSASKEAIAEDGDDD